LAAKQIKSSRDALHSTATAVQTHHEAKGVGEGEGAGGDEGRVLAQGMAQYEPRPGHHPDPTRYTRMVLHMP
jgi:hypothetical protein